jgi:hypothetical protein
MSMNPAPSPVVRSSVERPRVSVLVPCQCGVLVVRASSLYQMPPPAAPTISRLPLTARALIRPVRGPPLDE